MFLDMGPLEIVTIFVVAVVVIGPEKLPKAISETLSFIRKVRSISDTAQSEIRAQLDPEELFGSQYRDLHPQSMAERALQESKEELALAEFTKAFTSDAHHGEPGMRKSG
ncbi:hypothetical protein ABZ446_21280 [Streptomyces sp. NPDC005813]|uniref:hypothetical protein n=1 Tax=Streptomyces sp. NPDC005813 TaxID=3155592 RepID=UPI0033C757CE